jgi:hypothetical protein
VNDQYVKVARVKGTLTWHAHANEDELFYLLKGGCVSSSRATGRWS